MAEVAKTKKVTDLTENTDITDEDLFIAGSAGTASLRKIKWSNIWTKIVSSILNKITANNLITTAAGYLLDARQGKALDDKISELNTKITPKDILSQITYGEGVEVLYHNASMTGNHVTISLIADIGIQINETGTILQLPDIIPCNPTPFCAVGRERAYSCLAILSGRVLFVMPKYNDIPAGDRICFNFSFEKAI